MVCVSGTVVNCQRSQMAFLILCNDGSLECCSNYARLLHLVATRLKKNGPPWSYCLGKRRARVQPGLLLLVASKILLKHYVV